MANASGRSGDPARIGAGRRRSLAAPQDSDRLRELITGHLTHFPTG
ncbi:hypothetical protein ACIBKZ_25340 [Streptomyces sp. NPDC050421]